MPCVIAPDSSKVKDDTDLPTVPPLPSPAVTCRTRFDRRRTGRVLIGLLGEFGGDGSVGWLAAWKILSQFELVVVVCPFFSPPSSSSVATSDFSSVSRVQQLASTGLLHVLVLYSNAITNYSSQTTHPPNRRLRLGISQRIPSFPSARALTSCIINNIQPRQQ